jgi:hypothetical protein
MITFPCWSLEKVSKIYICCRRDYQTSRSRSSRTVNRPAVYCHPQGPRRSLSTHPVRAVMRRKRRRIFGTWRGAFTRRRDERYIYKSVSLRLK